jgi:hypothetical protein
MEKFKFVPLTFGLLFAFSFVLAENANWKSIELYKAGREAYQKNDWKTALEDFSAFWGQNLERLDSATAKPDLDFKEQLNAAIKDCLTRQSPSFKLIQTTSPTEHSEDVYNGKPVVYPEGPVIPRENHDYGEDDNRNV